MAVAIRNVWLIGDNLYTWFTTLSAYLSLLVNLGYNAANDWLTTYNELKQANTYIPGLSEVLYYLDDILSLVRDFEHNVDTVVRQRFPNLYSINLNPIAYILQVIYSNTGLSQSFLNNPLGFIQSIVNTALGDVRNLIANPYLYITAVLSRGNPDLYLLLTNPRMWLTNEIGVTFPLLNSFLFDPSGFILARLADGLERTIDSFGVRLAKVAEKIISFMF